MSRLTISKITEETGTYELAHNCTFIRDGETWYRDFNNEIRLRDMMREIIKNHSQYDEQYDDDLARVVFGEFNVIDVYTLETVDRVVGWHTEVIETDALSKCEPFCLPMPLTDLYIKRSEFEVFGNIFDNEELLEVK